MDYKAVLNGSAGFTAAGFAKTTLKTQTDFLMGLAAMRAANPAVDTPVFDSRTLEIMGDTGVQQPTKLDLDELTSASAASFVLLARHIGTKHPETGKSEEFLTRFLRDPKQVIQRAFDYRVQTQVMQAKATCEMIGADPGRRIEVIQAEAAKQYEAAVEPIQIAWLKCLKDWKDADDEMLIECCEEALTNAGKNVGDLISQAAKAYLGAQKKRAEAGGFVKVDAGIFGLANS